MIGGNTGAAEALRSGLDLCRSVLNADGVMLVRPTDAGHRLIAASPQRPGDADAGFDFDLATYQACEPTAVDDRRLPAALCERAGGRPGHIWVSEHNEGGARVVGLWLGQPQACPDAMRRAAAHALKLAALAPVADHGVTDRILNALPLAVIYFDDHADQVVANRAALRLFGLKRDEATPQAVTARVRRTRGDLTLPEEMGEIGDGFRMMEIGLDGRIYQLTTAPMRGDAGGRIWTLQDTTEAAAQKERLQEARRHALLNQVAGGVGHEFNNLLGRIICLIEMAMDAADPATNARLEAVIEAAQGGGDVVRKLAAYSGASILRRQSVDLNALIGGWLGPDGRRKGLTVQWNAPAAPVWADTDPDLTLAALDELFSNAVQAGAAMIDLTLEQIKTGREGRARLTVADDGRGMTDAVLNRATDPFFTTRAVGQGSGLGLSMVQGLMQQVGGRFRIANQEPRGAAVRLDFAIAAAPRETAVTTEATP